VALEPPPIDGARHRYVEIETGDVGRMRVHLAEAGAGAPVLLLHGWPEHFWCWRHVVPRLASDHRLVCPDLRGFGWSDAPGRGYDPQTFAADAIALLNTLGLERVSLIGHDWGGYTAFVLGLLHPDRVERMVVLNTPVPWASATPRAAAGLWRIWYVLVLAAPGSARAVLERRPHLLTRRLAGDGPGISAEDARVYAERLREPARSHASTLLYRSYLRAALDVGVRRPWHGTRLRIPTRLLFGTRDRYIPTALTEGWEPHADDMSVEYVTDSGHFIAEEKPELVATRAAELFAAPPRPRRADAR
jgi:pimeloyl-ACP methyl ester carboxylesterase